MEFPPCGSNETLVQSETLHRTNVTGVSSSGLTQMLDSVPCCQTFGGLQMPFVKLTVKLAFGGGEELVSSVESPAVASNAVGDGHAPYSFGESSTPEQPILVSSSDFVKVG